LLNASPEIRQQIESFTPLHPRSQRDTPIAGVVLTSGDLDHCLGLLSLRESQRLTVYATETVRAGFVDTNEMCRTLQRFDGQVTWRGLALGEELPLIDAQGSSALTLKALPVPGKPPLHARNASPHPEDGVGLRIRCSLTGGVLAYLSGVGGHTASLSELCEGADAVFFDGTFWSSDELITLGIGQRRAEDMSHWPISGERGSLRFLSSLKARRRVYIHINNTNPMLRDDSAEAAEVRTAGVEIAHDGMELRL
jgi:pyrroloquinoline quinone biosynthesis protein B